MFKRGHFEQYTTRDRYRCERWGGCMIYIPVTATDRMMNAVKQRLSSCQLPQVDCCPAKTE